MTSQTVGEEFSATPETLDAPHQQKAGNLALVQSIEQIPQQATSDENSAVDTIVASPALPNKQALSFLKVLTKGYELPEAITQRDAEMFAEMTLGKVHEVVKPRDVMTADEADEVIRRFVRGVSYEQMSEQSGHAKKASYFQVWVSRALASVHEQACRPKELHGMLSKFVALEEGPSVRPPQKENTPEELLNKNTRNFIKSLIKGYELPQDLTQSDADQFCEAVFSSMLSIKASGPVPKRDFVESLRLYIRGYHYKDVSRNMGEIRANRSAERKSEAIALFHERGYPPVVLNYLLNKFLAADAQETPKEFEIPKEYTYKKRAPRVTASNGEEFDDEAEPTEDELAKSQDDLDAAAPTTDLVRAYLTDIGKVQLLTAEQEVELAMQIDAARPAMDLLKLIKDTGLNVASEVKAILQEDAIPGIRATNHMLEANLRLVVSLAKRYQGKGLPLLDLIQEGNIGMVRAVEKFDYHKGYKFSTYATWWIRQALQRAIADKGTTIRIPVHMHETINKTLRIKRQLEEELGRPPTFAELGNEVGLSPDKTQEVLDYGKPVVSLDQPVGPGKSKDGQSESTLMDYVSLAAPSPLEEVIAGEAQDADIKLLQQLSPRDAMVLGALYGLGQAPQTHAQVANVLGCTVGFVKHLEREVLNQLRQPEFAPLLQQLAS